MITAKKGDYILHFVDGPLKDQMRVSGCCGTMHTFHGRRRRGLTRRGKHVYEYEAIHGPDRIDGLYDIRCRYVGFFEDEACTIPLRKDGSRMPKR